MDLRHLRYFVAAIEEGSIQAAAQRAHVAQPALSRRLRDLEGELGCDLLVRSARGVVPTAAGSTFYREALGILEGIDHAAQTARQVGREHAGNVRLGLVQTARKYGFINEAITAYLAEAPHSGLAFRWGLSGALGGWLREGQLDATLLYGRRHAPIACESRLIHAERFVLAVHPAHHLAASNAPLALSELSGEPMVWLHRRDGADRYDELRQQCRLHGLEPQIAHSTDNHVEQMDVTLLSGGLTLTPSTTVLTAPPGTLVFRPLRNFAAELRLSLNWETALAGSPAARLIAHLNAAIDRHRDALLAGNLTWAKLAGVDITYPG